MEEVNGCIGTSPSLPRVFGNMKLTADFVRAILGFKAVSLRLGVPWSNPPLLGTSPYCLLKEEGVEKVTSV